MELLLAVVGIAVAVVSWLFPRQPRRNATKRPHDIGTRQYQQIRFVKRNLPKRKNIL